MSLQHNGEPTGLFVILWCAALFAFGLGMAVISNWRRNR